MKIKFKKPGFYQHNYPAGSVVDVEENYGKYAVNMGDAFEVDPDTKVTDPVPYITKPKTTPLEDIMTLLAEDLKARRFVESLRAEQKADKR